MLEGPVKDFLPIMPSSNKLLDAPLPPPQTTDIFFQGVAANLKNVPYDNLVSGLPPSIKDIPPSDAKPALEALMLQEARNVYEDSNQPAALFTTNMRNRDLAATGAQPIQLGDRIHGMAINFFANAGNGILAPEFYGGKTESYTKIYCSLYVSQVANIPENSTPEQIVQTTHTEAHGLKEGTMTVVFDKDSPSKNIHQGVVGSVKPNSAARVISVGETLTSVKACIVANSVDVPQVKKTLESLKMYIPLYDGGGKLLFTHDDWLKAQKVG